MMTTTMMMAMTMMVMTNHPQTTFFGGLMRQTQLWNIFLGKRLFFLEEKEIYISEAHLQKNSLKNVFWSEFERQFPG